MLEKGTFEYDLATLLIGVDTLLGGNIGSKSGKDHFIAGNWTSGEPLPEIYSDSYAQHLRDKGGVGETGVYHKEVHDFIARYGLGNLANSISVTDPDIQRRLYIENLRCALGVILKTAVAIVDQTKLPDYKERYEAGIGLSFTGLVQGTSALTEERDTLRIALEHCGFNVNHTRNLRETFLAWHADRGFVPPERLEQVSKETIKTLFLLARQKIIAPLDAKVTGYSSDLSDADFEQGNRFELFERDHATAISTYYGGERDGRAALKALFQYNRDHPITKMGLWHICSHEIVPGHYLQAAMWDLLWRDRRLEFETTAGTMCTPGCALFEGVGQNGFYLMFDSIENAVDLLGWDVAVELAYADLQDIAKHDAPIMHQVYRNDLDEVRKFIAEECSQTNAHVAKVAGSWTTNPIIGPMYAGEYYKGRNSVRSAIKRKGRMAVANVVYGLDGIIDLTNFDKKFS